MERTWLHFRRARVRVCVQYSCVQNIGKEVLHRVLIDCYTVWFEKTAKYLGRKKLCDKFLLPPIAYIICHQIGVLKFQSICQEMSLRMPDLLCMCM